MHMTNANGEARWAPLLTLAATTVASGVAEEAARVVLRMAEELDDPVPVVEVLAVVVVALAETVVDAVVEVERVVEEALEEEDDDLEEVEVEEAEVEEEEVTSDSMVNMGE